MRLLILAYDFPPNGSIGGQRPYGWFKYLKEFGIHPVVVTRHWETVVTPEDTVKPCGKEITITESDEGTLIQVPFLPNLRDRMLLRFGERFSFIRKLFSLWFTLTQYFIPWVDNRRNILTTAKKYLQAHPCDAIIATGEPFILFRYAQLLSKEFRIPWVADYRDGWSTDYTIIASTSKLDKIVNRLFYQPIEQFVLGSCSQITCASPALKRELYELHPEVPCEVIYNGYFEEMFNDINVKPKIQRKPYCISYSGTVYPFQKAEIFLDGLQLLIKEHGLPPSELQVTFMGLEFQQEQRNRIMERHTDLQPFITSTPRIKQSEVIENLRNSDVLLLLANKEFGQIYAKVFEYIAVQAPVLVCENDRGPIESILNESGTGFFADTPAQVAETLHGLMSGAFGISLSQENVKRFTRRDQVRALSALLRRMVGKP